MTIRHCPLCQQQTLIATGAFWACSTCGLAVTGQALTIELSNASKNCDDALNERSRLFTTRR